jgi:hypothetical protein
VIGSTPPLRDLARAVRRALSHPLGDGAPAASLDLSGLVIDPPRVRECTVVEGTEIDAVSVRNDATVGFQAFLDGAQKSHVVDYAGTIPIVAGRTAAVIRTRIDRRMVTWGTGSEAASRLYAPMRLLSPSARRDIRATGFEVRDTLEPEDEVSGHPLELLRRAVDAVKRDRERQHQCGKSASDHGSDYAAGSILPVSHSSHPSWTRHVQCAQAKMRTVSPDRVLRLLRQCGSKR